MKFPINILILLLLGSTVTQTFGQNPFELEHRLEQQSDVTNDVAESEIDESGEETNFDEKNPFDIKKEVSSASKSQKVKPAPIIQDIRTNRRISSSTLFWILIFLTLLFAVIINLNRIVVSHLIKAWTNANFSNLLLRDKKGPDQLLYFLLAIIFYFNAGLFLGLFLENFYNIQLTLNRFLLYTGGIILIYLVRHGSLFWLANSFSIGKEVRQYSFTIHLFNILNGLLLLMANYIIVFSPDTIGESVLYIVTAILGIQFVYRNIRGLLLGAKYIVADRVHFFLYLCTCEIVPWILCFVTLSRMG